MKTLRPWRMAWVNHGERCGSMKADSNVGTIRNEGRPQRFHRVDRRSPRSVRSLRHTVGFLQAGNITHPGYITSPGCTARLRTNTVLQHRQLVRHFERLTQRQHHLHRHLLLTHHTNQLVNLKTSLILLTMLILSSTVVFACPCSIVG